MEGARFRILGGQGGGANSQQTHDVVTTSMRRNDVASTSFRRHVPTRFLINQCQIITFLLLKSDIIENSRIELRGIVLPIQIKITLIIILPFNLVHLWFFPVSHRNWRKRWVDYWEGQRVFWPPLKLLGGGGGRPPTPPLFLRLWNFKIWRVSLLWFLFLSSKPLLNIGCFQIYSISFIEMYLPIYYCI